MSLIIQNYISVLKKYATFSGRAGRKEYWYFGLANIIIWVVLSFFDGTFWTYWSRDYQARFLSVSSIYSLAILIPATALLVRRLHDISRSAWFLLVSLIPFAGPFIILFYAIEKSHPDANKYGPNPNETAKLQLSTEEVQPSNSGN